MCGGVHYGEVEGLVSVERLSCVAEVLPSSPLPVQDTGRQWVMV